MKPRLILLPVVLVLTFGLLPVIAQAADKHSTHINVPTISPRSEDVATLDGIMKAFYDVISGPADKPREWSRDRTLYVAGVRFVSMDVDKQGNPVASVMSHQEYVDRTEPFLKGRGFYEQEIHRVTRRFGNIAHIFSTYETREKAEGPVIARGINSVELFWDGKRWWIASAIWDDERKENPIPAEFLPGKE